MYIDRKTHNKDTKNGTKCHSQNSAMHVTDGQTVRPIRSNTVQIIYSLRLTFHNNDRSNDLILFKCLCYELYLYYYNTNKSFFEIIPLEENFGGRPWVSMVNYNYFLSPISSVPL